MSRDWIQILQSRSLQDVRAGCAFGILLFKPCFYGWENEQKTDKGGDCSESHSSVARQNQEIFLSTLTFNSLPFSNSGLSCNWTAARIPSSPVYTRHLHIHYYFRHSWQPCKVGIIVPVWKVQRDKATHPSLHSITAVNPALPDSKAHVLSMGVYWL